MKQESFIMKQQTARDFHIDNIKGVLIFLVVLGHMLGYFAGNPFRLCHRRENLYLFFSTCRGLSSCRAIWQRAFSRRNIRRKSCSPSHGSIFCSRMSSSWCISSLSDHILKRHTTPAVWASLFCCSAAAFGCSLCVQQIRALFRKAFVLAF